jgi:RNA polymerase sigma-70 factor, ECF subfamily
VKCHRKDLNRIDWHFAEAKEHHDKPEYFRRRVAAAESNVVIFSDDPDATEKLVDKVERLKKKAGPDEAGKPAHPQSGSRRSRRSRAAKCRPVAIFSCSLRVAESAPLSLLLCDNSKEIDDSAASDDQLMKAVVNGEGDALKRMYKRYESLLRAVIFSLTHDESEVDDVLHDVLLQVWEQGNRYNPSEKGLYGLLVTLARRRALDRLRRRPAYRRATENLKADTDNPLTFETASTSNEIELHDLSKLLSRAIRELPEAQQEVIDLAFFKGMSQREIAAKRRISLGTVKTRLHLAQLKL